MPYSDEHQVIFLHVPKTGGTAIAELLRIRQFSDPSSKTRPTPQHYTSAMLRERLGEDTWTHYYSFTFVRNPWARLLSTYYWRQQLPKKRPMLPFGNFVEHAGTCVANRDYYDEDFGDHFIPQVEFADGVDEVFHFEAFADSIRTVAERLAMAPPVVPPKSPKPQDDYRTYYDDRIRARVAEIYADDIAEFDYSF